MCPSLYPFKNLGYNSTSCPPTPVLPWSSVLNFHFISNVSLAFPLRPAQSGYTSAYRIAYV